VSSSSEEELTRRVERMMNFKQSIIYTLILTMISGSFGFSQSALAEPSSQQTAVSNSNHSAVGDQIARENLLHENPAEVVLPPPTLTVERLDQASANLAESSGDRRSAAKMDFKNLRQK
jgi:hypothetical protein